MAKTKRYTEQLIEAFILGKNKNDIAQRTGLSLKTIYRYSCDPVFQEMLNKRKAEYVKASVNKMQTMLLGCAEKLEEIINDPDTPRSTQVSAIQTVYNQCKEWTVTADILERLEAVEKAQKDL